MKYKEVSDDRFQFVTDFSIKVPTTYCHYRQMREFRYRFGTTGTDEIHKRVYVIEDGFVDGKLSHSSFRFMAGKPCLVVIFQVKRKVSCDEVLQFLRTIEADFVGGHGTTLLWPQAKLMLPETKRVVSFDVEEHLPTVNIVRQWKGPYTVDEKIGVPYIFRYSNDDVGFHFAPYDEGLREEDCIACFKQGE